jgi:hypothetical protein
VKTVVYSANNLPLETFLGLGAQVYIMLKKSEGKPLHLRFSFYFRKAFGTGRINDRFFYHVCEGDIIAIQNGKYLVFN